ncbi:MAG: arginase [Fimbriimonadaceae bacterium]
MIEILGVPLDYCGRRHGSRLGPAAVRTAGLKRELEELGLAVVDSGDRPIEPETTDFGGIRAFEPAYSCYLDLKGCLDRTFEAGRVPIVIGGDHSIAFGSVSAAMDRHGDTLAVLWLDAHADLNTPATSPSGNLHGMPLAALMEFPADLDGRTREQWQRLRRLRTGPPLAPEKMAWIGLRDLDEGERRHIRQLRGCFPATMHEIDRFGVVEVMRRFDRWLRASGATRLWVSFDVDALDPIWAPGTGTAVRGGLTYREMHLIFELLWELISCPDCPYKLAGMDLVEVNPLEDSENLTARLAVKWVLSMFGKTILGNGVRI